MKLPCLLLPGFPHGIADGCEVWVDKAMWSSWRPLVWLMGLPVLLIWFIPGSETLLLSSETSPGGFPSQRGWNGLFAMGGAVCRAS